MNYLIDTHILIWFIEGNEKLSKQAQELIINPANNIYISQASLEVVQKQFTTRFQSIYGRC